MDLLTRKKLLMRKYTNPTFTIEELDFFGKINATQIIVLLKENPTLRTSTKFFQHASIKQLEKIIASIFQPQESFARSQIFNILVNLLRESTTVLQVCFKNEQFNYMSMFGFLEQDHIDYAILILLEDVLLPYIRKTPFQLIKIISNDLYMEELFLRRVYEKPIFKVLYTVIFCLSRRHSQQHQSVIRKIIHQLVNTPFTYLLHKNKKISQKITIIAQDKTELKSPQKQNNKANTNSFYDNSAKQLFPPVHTKKVREKKRSSLSVQSGDQNSGDQQQFVHKKKQSNGSTMKKSQQSRSSFDFQAIMSEQNLGHVTQHHLLRLHGNSNIHSLTELQEVSYKRIPLNEDLCYGDLTDNMKQLLSDIGLNIKYVHINNVLMLLQNFNQAYVDSLITHVKRYVGVQQFDSYCYGAVFILYEFGQLYKSVMKYEKTVPKNSNTSRESSAMNNSNSKLSDNNNNNRNDSVIRNTSTGGGQRQRSAIMSTILNCTEHQAQLMCLINKLQKEIKIIATKLPTIVNCLVENNEPYLNSSSGERLKKVTMTKYKMIELVTQLLVFNSHKQNPQSYLDLTLHINFGEIDLYNVINKYLLSVKWNSILHSALIKLMKLLLEQDYQGFKSKCITNTQPKDSILGTLFQLYRNKKYIHLTNVKFTNYGNIHLIYDLTTVVMEYVIKNNDYQLVIQRFGAFENFIHNDILGYQNKFDCISEWFDPKLMPRQSQMIQCSVPCEDMNGRIISASLQNAQQLMNEMQNSKRWMSFNMAKKQTI